MLYIYGLALKALNTNKLEYRWIVCCFYFEKECTYTYVHMYVYVDLNKFFCTQGVNVEMQSAEL